jgi:hypothetical protein
MELNYNTYFTDAGRNIQEQQPPNTQISFDDILSSMTMNVVNGKIQLSTKAQQQQPQSQQSYQNTFSENTMQVPHVPVPQLTREQYRRQLFFLHLNQQEEIRRIKAIKSRQLFFSRNFDQSSIRFSAPQQRFR